MQALPHAPQLAGSVCSRTQMPLHLVKPGWHWQLPLMQVPLEQAFPHEPQLAASAWVLTHSPLHLMKPVGQVIEQTPAEHV